MSVIDIAPVGAWQQIANAGDNIRVTLISLGVPVDFAESAAAPAANASADFTLTQIDREYAGSPGQAFWARSLSQPGRIDVIYQSGSGSGSSTSLPLSLAQATNPVSTVSGLITGQLLNAAVSAFENAGMAGSYNASSPAGAFPNGTNSDGQPIKQGDYFLITTAGTVAAGVANGPTAAIGDKLTALIDNPTLSAHWVLDKAVASVPATAVAGVAVSVAANGQTSFTLPTTPTDPTSVVLLVNGQEFYNPADFTVSGQTVNWLGAFTLSTTDSVRFRYS